MQRFWKAGKWRVGDDVTPVAWDKCHFDWTAVHHAKKLDMHYNEGA